MPVNNASSRAESMWPDRVMSRGIIALTVLVAILLTVLLSCGPARATVTFTGPAPLVTRADEWQAHSHVWLGDETVALTNVNICPGDPTGCSYFGTTYAADPAALYFELGHQLDWTYLTGANRRYLARRWEADGWHWADTAGAVALGDEDGLAAIFSTYVEDCAFGHPDLSMSMTLMANGPEPMPSVNAGNFNTCTWLAFLGAQVGGQFVTRPPM